MKKLVSLFLSLLLCMSVLAASLQAVGNAAAPDPDPAVTTVIAPSDPDGLNTIPPRNDTEDTE